MFFPFAGILLKLLISRPSMQEADSTVTSGKHLTLGSSKFGPLEKRGKHISPQAESRLLY